ncbi:SusD/RagB family nutrient-binding outer membrane lipoprotein [Zobellia nedashkovskayae]
MKTYSKIIQPILLSLVFLGCENVDFGDTNSDPDVTTTVVSSGLLTFAERYIGDVVTDEMGDLYTQHISQITYTDGSRYTDLSADSDYLYQNPLINLKTIIDFNSDEQYSLEQSAYGSNANQIAVAKILMAYYYQFMTDRWGMMPYTEALQGTENTYPVFDTQEAIYDGLFTDIDDALALIDDGARTNWRYSFWRRYGALEKIC